MDFSDFLLKKLAVVYDKKNAIDILARTFLENSGKEKNTELENNGKEKNTELERNKQEKNINNTESSNDSKNLSVSESARVDGRLDAKTDYKIDSKTDVKKPRKSTKKLTALDLPPIIQKALSIAEKCHAGQFRKRKDPNDKPVPYIVHPISVAAIVAYFNGDETMICAALLHDIIEDCLYTKEQICADFGEYGKEVADNIAELVDALTKIGILREDNLQKRSPTDKFIESAKTFQKLILASIKEPSVLLLKLCDRMHNMLSLEVHRPDKQERIAKETLLVYVPIAARLGISSLKNALEDRSFFYLYEEDYYKIDEYLNAERQNLNLKLNAFYAHVAELLEQNGMSDYKLESRVKRSYSIHLKMQRKGINIDEILDLLAIRILVPTPLDCYKALGIIHTNLQPIVSRLKDYIALPKENGYRTIHTTVFDKGSVYEVQIRTFEMHETANFGLAAHWKYKSGGRDGAESSKDSTNNAQKPSLNWLYNIDSTAHKNSSDLSCDIESDDSSTAEFFELAKNDLYKEEVAVFSPKGKVVNLPKGAVALDFAYAIHSDIGDRAKGVLINQQKASLLTPLKIGDIVEVIVAKEGEKYQPKYSWMDAVKSSRAKVALRTYYQHRRKDIEKKAAINILATIFDKSVDYINYCVAEMGLDAGIFRAVRDINYLKEVKAKLKQNYDLESFFSRLKIQTLALKELRFNNIIIHSNRNIASVAFDYCCHPKFGDEILALKNERKVIVHHKFCEAAMEQVESGVGMVFVGWFDNENDVYKLVARFQNRPGSLAAGITTLGKFNCNIVKIEFDGVANRFASECTILFETARKGVDDLRAELNRKFSVVELSLLKDAYAKK